MCSLDGLFGVDKLNVVCINLGECISYNLNVVINDTILNHSGKLAMHVSIAGKVTRCVS